VLYTVGGGVPGFLYIEFETVIFSLKIFHAENPENNDLIGFILVVVYFLIHICCRFGALFLEIENYSFYS
jgi:hypothetical protein